MIWPFKKSARKQIARIEISGAIAGSTRKDTLKAIKTIKERKFPALLLRIDSPGGTVGDSQEIYAALKDLGDAGVKVVASFGNISASGGIYIAMGAQHVVSNAGTVTGSIGVILRGNNLEKLLDRVGVSFKVIKSGPYKDILSFDRELTEEERVILQSLIDSSYDQFVQAVAEARNLEPDVVRQFADGRVFTGAQALDFGLVDRLGSEEDARRWAAELAGLDPDKAPCQNLTDRKSPLARLVGSRGSAIVQALAFEVESNGAPLWLYRP